jgi:RND family efflux transporter MFP subunit
MNMAGASGSATRVAAGRYAFDLPLGMAATWSVTIHATGGVTGTTTFVVPVASSAGGSAAAQAMSGMAGASGGGDVGPWRTAAFVLLVIVIVLAVVSRRARTPWALTILGVAAAVAIAVAALQVHVDAQPGSMNGMDMNAMSDVKGDAPVTVRTVAVATVGGSADPDVFAPGTLAPYLLQDIVARSPGLLQDFSIYAGDHVKAGQVLAHLDEPELAARAGASSADALAQSRAADAAAIDAASRAPATVVAGQAGAAAAQLDAEGAVADLAAKEERRRYWSAELAREQTLLNEGAVSEQEFQDERAEAAAADADATMAMHRVHASQAQVRAARAKVVDASASAQIARATAESMHAQAERAAQGARIDAIMAGYATVVAPMDGIVLKRLVDPGTYVQAGTVIARVAVVDRLRVQANIAEGDLSGISIGTPISARTSDGITLHGRVSSVAPVVDPSTRTAAVEAIVDNPGRHAVPGGYVRVIVAARSAVPRNAMQVPSAAVVRGTEDPAVWRVVDGSVERVPVRVISDDGHAAYIMGDLHSGDRIVIDGATDLQTGARVAEASS